MFFLEAFFDSLLLVMWIVDFILLANAFKDAIPYTIVRFILAGIITFLLVIPYTWFAILIFLALFGYAFFWGFQPWTWGIPEDEDEDDKSFKAKIGR